MAFVLGFRWFGGRCGDKALFSQEFRRLRAATYFAHGGKVGKTPPGTRPMDYGFAMLRLGP